LQLAFYLTNKPGNNRTGNRPLGTRNANATLKFFPVKILSPPVLFDQVRRRLYCAFIGAVTLTAFSTLPSPPYSAPRISVSVNHT
jgi:hypothetical protein